MAQHSGISARMLRHYDRIGLVTPSERTSGGYREYSEDDVRRLFHVEGLRTLGLSLAQIAEVIDDREFDPGSVVEKVIERTHRQIAQAQDLVQRLEEVKATGPRTWSDVLRSISLIRGLEAATPSNRQRLALTIDTPAQGDVPVLVDAMLREQSEDAAGALQWAIARNPDTAVAALADALYSENGDRRRRAFDALVKLDTAAARRVIMAAADHEDARIRSRAIIMRAQQGEGGSITALVGLIRDGLDDVDATDALAEFATREDAVDRTVAEVARSLETAGPPARRRLVAALNAFPLGATKSTLLARLDDDDRATALTAKYMLDTGTSG
ncbi:MerR family transcriptional regulator [Microbacterium sp.]|uniref:MerR family transcriptional regulator n=1 Tax=Microbacterium sp. TaxID=51671 RepID=UPI003C74407A